MREYRAQRAAERDGAGLLPFQAAFVAAVCRVNHPPDVAALMLSVVCGRLSCPIRIGKVVVSWPSDCAVDQPR